MKSYILSISSVVHLIISFFMFSAGDVRAGNYSWLGGINTHWYTSTNWSPAGIPSINDTVTITTNTGAYNLVMDSAKTVYRLVMQADTIDLGSQTLYASSSSALSGGTITNGTLDLRGSTAVFSGAIINATVVAVASKVCFNGSVFNSDVTVDITGSATDTSTGGNTFNGSFALSNSGLGRVLMAYTNGDSYQGTVSLYDTGNAVIDMAMNDTSFFNDDITVGSTGAGIRFGNPSGIAIIDTGKTLSVGAKGFSSGTLLLNNFIQQGSTAQSLTLTGSGILSLMACEFGGDIAFTAPSLLAKTSLFHGKSIFTKTGSVSNSWEGGNTFEGPFRFTNNGSGSGHVIMQTNAGDVYEDSVTVNGGSPRYYPNTADTSRYYGDIYFNGSNVDFSQGNGTMKINGAGNQLISGTTNLPVKNMVLDKSAGTLTLAAPVTMTGSLEFENGILVSDTTHVLAFAVGSSCSGASNQSFVSGPVKKTGNTAFTFPVGKAGALWVAGISAPANASDAFTAEYFDGENPMGNTLDSTLTSISSCGYWSINRNSGNSGVKVTLGWDTIPCMDHTDTLIRMGVWNNNQWQGLSIDTCPSNTNSRGRITTLSATATFGKFIVGNVQSVIVFVDFQSAPPQRTINDYFGLNVWDVIATPNAYLEDPDCQEDIVRQSPGTLRFPAGIEANWWDWRHGGFVRDRMFNNITYYLPEQFHDRVLAANPVIDAEIQDFYRNIYNTGSTPFFSLNNLSSDVLFQTALLYDARRNNIPVQLMELGGEVYKEADYNDVRFPTGKEYADLCIEWGREIKDLFHLDPLPSQNTTNFQLGLCVATFNPSNKSTRTAKWNSTLFNRISSYNASNSTTAFRPDAIILHDYTGTGLYQNPPNLCGKKSGWSATSNHRVVSPFDPATTANGTGKFCKNDMELIFSNVFRSFAGEAYKTDYLGLINEELDPNSSNSEKIPTIYNEIWLTEYNCVGKGAIFDGTWAHGLAVALQTMLYLESDRITKVNCFKLIGEAIYAAVFGNDDAFNYSKSETPSPLEIGTVTTVTHAQSALGLTLGLVARALRNADEATRLSFSGVKLPHFDYYKRYNSTAYEPQIYGWHFSDSSDNEQIIIINLSEKEISLQIPSILGTAGPMGNMDAYEQIYCDPAAFITGGSPNFNVITGHDLVNDGQFLITQAVPLHPYSIMRLFKRPCQVTLKPVWDRACEGTTVSLVAHGESGTVSSGWNYTWNIINGDVIPDPNANGPVGTPTGSTMAYFVNSSTSSPAEFSVEMTDLSGCTATATASVTLLPNPQLVVTTPPVVSCQGDPLDITMQLQNSNSQWGANFILINSLGEGLGSYQFTNGSTVTPAITFQPEHSADYTVYVYDGECVVLSEPFTISIPEIELGPDLYICSGETYSITGEQVPDFAAWTDVTSATYSWNDGNGVVSTDANPDFTVTSTTTYTVTVTLTTAASATCSFSDDITLFPVSCCSGAADITLNNISITDPSFESLCGGFYSSNPNGTIVIDGGTGTPIEVNINGRLRINGQNLQVINCHLNMGEAAEILVDPHFVLRLQKTTVNPCSLMWRGVRLEPSAKIAIVRTPQNRSEINGAEFGILANERCIVDLQTLDMNRNLISFFVPPSVNNAMNYVDLTISDTRFSCPSCNTTPLPGPYTGQVTTTGSYTYAGMVLNDMAGTIGINGQDPVEFSELNNGIIANNSSLLVENTTFTQIQNTDNYAVPTHAYPGTCIFSGADPGNYASLIQKGKLNTVSFSSSTAGIHSFRSSLSATNNVMEEMTVGIVAQDPGMLPVEISNNDIEAFMIGVGLDNTVNSAKVLVDNNSIHTWGSASVFNIAGFRSNDAGEGLAKDQTSLTVKCNTVYGNFRTGMEVNGSVFGAFLNNTVLMDQSNMEKGFHFMNTFGADIDNNNANGNSTSHGIGFSFLLNNALKITNNHSYDTKMGFNFLALNTNTVFRTNNMGAHETGLYLNGSAIIGPQYSMLGNTTTVFNNHWLQESSPKAAYADGAALLDNTDPDAGKNSQFLVPSSSQQGSMDFPYYIPPSSQWFKTVPNPTVAQPSYSSNCPGNGNNNLVHDTLQPLDERIALDSIYASEYETQMQYMSASDLQYKLRSHEELINSDTIYSNFFDARENSVCDELCLVKTAQQALYDAGLPYRSALFSADSIVNHLLSQKSVLDTVLASCTHAADSGIIMQEIAGIEERILEAQQDCNTILSSWLDMIDDEEDDLLTTNGNISVSDLIDQNQQDVTAIQLEKIFIGNGEYTSGQQSALSTIASQCPYEGGRAVLRAWALLKSRGDSTWYDAEALCDTSGNPRIAIGNSAYFDFRVMPNPASGDCIFSFKGFEDGVGNIRIYNAFGCLTDVISIKPRRTPIHYQTEKLAAGIYFCKLSIEGKRSEICKLIVIH